MLQRLAQKAKGFRTLMGSAALGMAGALGVLGTLDLTPVVQLFVKNPAYLGVAMLGVALFFGLMRYVTDSAPGGYQSAYQSAPTFKGVDDGA